MGGWTVDGLMIVGGGRGVNGWIVMHEWMDEWMVDGRWMDGWILDGWWTDELMVDGE